MNNIRVIHMVTISKSVNLMNGQIDYLKKKGYKVGLISSPGKEIRNQDVDYKKEIRMSREIDLISDVISLIKIVKYLIIVKPHIVNTGTPKAGLLGIVASFIARVPNRIYTLRGLRLETEKGVKRKILWLTEKIACSLSTEVICISPSLLKEARRLKLLKKNKGIVFGRGSSNGINLSRYPKRKTIKNELEKLKSYLNIHSNHFVLGFVGRLTRDKGIMELFEAFSLLQKKFNNIRLLILGDIEETENLRIHDKLNNKKIIYIGHVERPEMYYYLMDVLLFPTYREGFGNVSIQAQAAGTPVIASDVTGARDTLIDGKTGFLIPGKDSNAIVKKVEELIRNRDLGVKIGQNARDFVFENFDSKLIWEKLDKFYRSQMKRKVI